MPWRFTAKDTEISFAFSDKAYFITASDGKTKTHIVYADKYSPEYFPDKYDIAAFFTRETANQFDKENHTLPNAKKFVTRLKKDEVHDGITSTFGLSEFYIKE